MRHEFGTTLRALLDEQGVSVSELARRVARIEGTKPESERRDLNFYLAGDKLPSEESTEAIRKALGVEVGDLPTPAPSRVSASKLVSRLETRLDEGVKLAPAQAETLAALGISVAAIEESQKEIVARLVRLEALTQRAVGDE